MSTWVFKARMILQRYDVNRYRTSDGEFVYSNTPLISKYVIYGTPARLNQAECEALTPAQRRIVEQHVLQYNGGAINARAANAKRLEDVVALGGLVDPTHFPAHFRIHARILFGIVCAMKRYMRVWIRAADWMPEYFSLSGAEKAVDELLRCGCIQKRDEYIAIDWAAKIDDEFSSRWALSARFQYVEYGTAVPSTEEYNPQIHGIQFDARMANGVCMIKDRKIPVTATSKYLEDILGTRVLPELAYPAYREISLSDMQKELFSEKPYPHVVTVSEYGLKSILPLEYTQLRVIAPFGGFRCNDLLWMLKKLTVDHRTAECIYGGDQRAYFSVAHLNQKCLAVSGVTCEMFAMLECKFDVVVFLYGTRFHHVWHHAHAVASRVEYIKLL